MNLMTLLKPKGEIEYLHKEDTLRQGLERMRIYGYTALPVIDEDGCYAGSVNEGDFLWYMLTYHKCDMQELESFQIKEIIRKDWMPPVYVYATIDEMIERASNQNYVPVVDDRNVFIGIITRRDIINAFRRQQDQQTDQNEGIKIPQGYKREKEHNRKFYSHFLVVNYFRKDYCKCNYQNYEIVMKIFKSRNTNDCTRDGLC